MGAKRPRKAKNMSSIERAYVGALLDAEGSLSPHSSWPRSWRMQVSNTEVELISALLRATGVGRVYYDARDGNTLGSKAIWTWMVQPYNDVLAIVRQLQKFSIKAQVALPCMMEVY